MAKSQPAKAKRDGGTEDREPDTARTYERAKPEKESGMGRLDEDPETPVQRPDRAERAVRNAHRPREHEDKE